MTVAGLLPKLAVFLAATVVGGVVAFTAMAAINRPRLAPTAGDAPDFTLTSAGTVAAFDLIDAQRGSDGRGRPVPGGSRRCLRGPHRGRTAGRNDPARVSAGRPRQPVRRRRLPGSELHTGRWGDAGAPRIRDRHEWVDPSDLQSDKVGGTDLHDLQRAVFHGYGVQFSAGSLTPRELKRLLTAGYGAVIQGVYGVIPAPARLQPAFTGGHAIYLDGFYPGNGDIPPAYYVIDPLGNGKSYRGEWWPASVVDAFGLAFGGGTRIPAAWVFPPGGAPPPIVVPRPFRRFRPTRGMGRRRRPGRASRPVRAGQRAGGR